MTREDKFALFGEYFADKPKQYRLLAGEKCSIHAAVAMCKKLLESYEKSYIYEKLKTVKGLKRKRKQVQQNKFMGNIALDINKNISVEGNEDVTLLVTRKGKTSNSM